MSIPATAPRRCYPTDVTDAEWEVIGPEIEQAPDGGGHPRDVTLRDVWNARAYTLRTGC